MRYCWEKLLDYPGQVIVGFQGGKSSKITFSGFYSEVNDVIRRLRMAGVGEGVRVGLLGENSLAWVACDFAIAAVGAVSVAFPEEYIHHGAEALMDRYGLGVLLVSKKYFPVERPLPLGLAALEDATEISLRQMDDGTHVKDPDEHSYVFSSGTAGVSKGMVVSSSGSLALIRDFSALFKLRKGQRILVFMPLSGYQQRLFLYAAVLHGLSIALVQPAQVFRALKELAPQVVIGPPALYEAIRAQAPEMPSYSRSLARMLSVFIRTMLPAICHRSLLSRLYKKQLSITGGQVQTMISGMAKISPDTIAFFHQRGLPLYEVYGLTETGVIAANTPSKSNLGSVGVALPNTAITIAPDGEILVQKAMPLTLGYFQLGGMPTGRVPFDTVLPTGDLGSFDQRGFLYITGRKNNLIVSAGGHKIQPEVLESQIERIPGIRRAVVMSVGAPAYLAAIIVTATDSLKKANHELIEILAELNAAWEPWSRVQKFVFTDKDFTMENGLLNRSLKIDRVKVFNEFSASFCL